MVSQHAVSAYWEGGFDELPLRKWAEGLRQSLGASKVSLGILFMTPPFFGCAPQVLELLRVHAQIPLLIGCSSNGLIAGPNEMEDRGGLVLGLYSFPDAVLEAIHFTPEQVEEANGPAYWHLETGRNPDQTNGWLVFADPFHLDSELWVRQWNEAYSPLPIVGGLASGDPGNQRTQVYLNGQVYEEGGVALSCGGGLELANIISQGCTPIGETWTITRAERNLIYEIGNRPAYEVLVETFNNLPPAEQKKAQGNLFIGLVINEYLEEFQRGDFLVRNLLGADPQTGSLAVGAFPRLGQTLQFQRRDAAAATEDIGLLLESARKRLATTTIYGGCLSCCNGRGVRLFGSPSHDAAFVEKTLGPLGLTGFFCNGEIGPVGDRTFLHGYTASLALFVAKRAGAVGG